MSRILIFDPHSSGHHPVYIERFINNLFPYSEKHQFTFAVPAKTIALLSEEAKRLAKEHSYRFVEIDFESYRKTRAICGVSIAERRLLSQLLSLGNYDSVILFYGDHIVNSVGVFPLPSVKCVALFFRAPILEPKGGPLLIRTIERVKIRTRRWLLRSFLKSGSNNKGLFLDFRMTDSKNEAYGLCPEPTVDACLPTEETLEIAKRFPADDTRINMLLAGGITQRKGTAQFLSLLTREALPTLRKIRLIIGGEILDADEGRRVEALIDQLKKTGVSVLTDFTRIDEQTYAYLFEYTDIVTVPYIDHFGPSGVVSHAIRAGKCILGCDGGWIGEIVRKYGNGLTYRTDDCASFSNALTGVLQSYKSDYCSDFRDEFVRFNNETHFTKVIMDSLEGIQ